jgi:hypothetical protein
MPARMSLQSTNHQHVVRVPALAVGTLNKRCLNVDYLDTSRQPMQVDHPIARSLVMKFTHYPPYGNPCYQVQRRHFS